MSKVAAEGGAAAIGALDDSLQRLPVPAPPSPTAELPQEKPDLPGTPARGPYQGVQPPSRVRFLGAPYFHIAWAATQPGWRYVTLLAFAGITVPFAIRVAQLIPTSDNALIYLQGSPALNAYTTMKESFAIGALDEYSLILATGVPGAALTREYFSIENSLVHAVLATEPAYVSSASFTALSYANGADIAFDTAMSYLLPTSPAYNTSSAVTYRVRCASKLNADNSTSLVTIQVTVDPDSQAMASFINDVRALIANWGAGKALPVSVYLFGGYTTTLDGT